MSLILLVVLDQTSYLGSTLVRWLVVNECLVLNKVDGNTVINNVTVRWCCVRLRSITLIITVVFV